MVITSEFETSNYLRGILFLNYGTYKLYRSLVFRNLNVENISIYSSGTPFDKINSFKVI